MDIKRVIRGTKEFDELFIMACTWWSFWKFTPPPVEFLPMNMLCAYNGDVPACIGFLYSTDSKIAWLEFIVSNPGASKEDRHDGLEMLLSSTKILASALGFGAIFTTSRNQSLNKKLEKKYQTTDMGVTHFVGKV